MRTMWCRSPGSQRWFRKLSTPISTRACAPSVSLHTVTAQSPHAGHARVRLKRLTGLLRRARRADRWRARAIGAPGAPGCARACAPRMCSSAGARLAVERLLVLDDLDRHLVARVLHHALDDLPERAGAQRGHDRVPGARRGTPQACNAHAKGVGRAWTEAAMAARAPAPQRRVLQDVAGVHDQVVGLVVVAVVAHAERRVGQAGGRLGLGPRGARPAAQRAARLRRGSAGAGGARRVMRAHAAVVVMRLAQAKHCGARRAPLRQRGLVRRSARHDAGLPPRAQAGDRACARHKTPCRARGWTGLRPWLHELTQRDAGGCCLVATSLHTGFCRNYKSASSPSSPSAGEILCSSGPGPGSPAARHRCRCNKISAC